MQGQIYCPNRHWTSRMREVVGHECFISLTKPVATFEVIEPSTKMKHFLKRYSSGDVSNRLQEARKIYFDVQVPMNATTRTLDFCPRRFEKVFEAVFYKGCKC